MIIIVKMHSKQGGQKKAMKQIKEMKQQSLGHKTKIQETKTIIRRLSGKSLFSEKERKSDHKEP